MTRPWWQWLLLALGVIATGGLLLFVLRRPAKAEIAAAKAEGKSEAFEVVAGAARGAGDALVVEADAAVVEVVAARAETARADAAVVEAKATSARIDAASDLDDAIDEFKKGRQ